MTTPSSNLCLATRATFRPMSADSSAPSTYLGRALDCRGPERSATLDTTDFTMVAIEVAEAAAVKDLERGHGDPFDRIQVAQARRRGWQVISRDPIFDRYGLRRIW